MHDSIIIAKERQTNRVVIIILWIIVLMQFPVTYLLGKYFPAYIATNNDFLSGLVSAAIAITLTLLYFNKQWVHLVKYFNVVGIYLMLIAVNFITGNDLSLQGAWAGAMTVCCLYFDPFLTILAGILAFLFQIIFGLIFPKVVNLDPRFIGAVVITQLLVTIGVFIALWSLTRKTNSVLSDLNVTLYSIGEGVITLDPKGRINIINKVAEELTGWNMEEGAGKKLEEVFWVINHQTDTRFEKIAQKILKKGDIIPLKNNTILISKNGEEKHVDGNFAPIKNNEGKKLGIVLVFRDITENR